MLHWAHDGAVLHSMRPSGVRLRHVPERAREGAVWPWRRRALRGLAPQQGPYCKLQQGLECEAVGATHGRLHWHIAWPQERRPPGGKVKGRDASGGRRSGGMHGRGMRGGLCTRKEQERDVVARRRERGGCCQKLEIKAQRSSGGREGRRW
eukprot:354726-Chlamydomonas_euryale.AAC.7